MSGGEQFHQTGTQEAYSAVLPEIAWQHQFEGGILRVAWSASHAYGLDPAIQVQARPPDEAPIVGMQDTDLPGMNVTILGPEEANFGAQAILGVRNTRGLGTEANHSLYTIKPGRINMVMSLPVTKQDRISEQAAYLKLIYANKWQSSWEQRLEQPDGFSYLAGHLLTEIAKYKAIDALTDYRGHFTSSSSHRSYNPRPDIRMTEESYGNSLRYRLHGVLCRLAHTNDVY